MYLKSLYEPPVKAEILARLDKISPDMLPLWGKMNPAQMFAHCSEVLDLALNKTVEYRTWIAFFVGGWFKHTIYEPKPFKRGLMTAPSFVMTTTQKDFDAEKAKLVGFIHKFVENGAAAMIGKYHPLFGTLTPDQWGISQWKHLQHHLEQFGV